MTYSPHHRSSATTNTRTTDRYRRFADREVLALIDTLPEAKRQPNLVFAAARFVGTPVGAYAGFRDALITRWDTVRDVALVRRTQTNEAGRCAILLPLLAALPQPLALLEVGASAGLCLCWAPGRCSTAPPPGPFRTRSRCPRWSGGPGIDLNPLDVRAPDDVRWLDP